MELLLISNPLGSISVFQLIIDAGMLIIVLVTFIIASNKSYQDKFDGKASNERVIKIEEDMECIKEKKADADYVRELNRAAHHRIEETNLYTLGILNQIQSSQAVIQEDIKDILKRLK